MNNPYKFLLESTKTSAPAIISIHHPSPRYNVTFFLLRRLSDRKKFFGLHYVAYSMEMSHTYSMDGHEKKHSRYFWLQQRMGFLLILLSFLMLMPTLRDYTAGNFRQDYLRFVLSGSIFLFFSLFLCYPDSKWIRFGQVVFCLSYATADFLLVYSTNNFGPFDLGLLVVGGILYVSYDFPKRSMFYIIEIFLFLFISFWRTYILRREVDFGSLLIYIIMIIAMGGKNSFEKLFSLKNAQESMPVGLEDFSDLDTASVKKRLSQTPEANSFSVFEILVMSEFFCSKGNATNKELAAALSVSESLVKNTISGVFRKVPAIHSRTGLYHYVHQQLLGTCTEKKAQGTQ